MAIKYGHLHYDSDQERWDVAYTDNRGNRTGEHYGGLHCGDCFDAKIDGEWVPTRIEYSDDWYLVGLNMKGNELYKTEVRI